MSLESQRISPARLAWIMDVSDSTVEEWIRRRLIPSFKVGRVRRFDPADVLAFIRAYTAHQKAESRKLKAEITESDWARIERLIRGAINTETQRRRGETANVEPETEMERAA